MKSGFRSVLLLVALLATSSVSVKSSPIKADEATTTTTTTAKPVYGAWPPNTTICYDELGCFENSAPFNNTGNYLPIHPDLIGTEFLLFSRANPTEYQTLTYKDLTSIQDSKYNRNLPLKFIIHGFSNNRETLWIKKLKDAILKKDNVNVIVVDWGAGAEFPLYNNASSNTRLVGRQVCLLVKAVQKVFYESQPSDLKIHCIGHSLGAQTCGYASSHCGSTFDRISALDPAGPFFEDTHPMVRVDPTDAKFVDVIHSNAGTLLSGSFGFIAPTGHIDFYPNGGRQQPGCPGLSALIGGIFGSNALDPTKEASCSHNRAIAFFTESIENTCGFTAFQCGSTGSYDKGECFKCEEQGCPQMGYYADKFKNRGTYYLTTNDQSPFCGSLHFAEMFVSPKMDKTAGDTTMFLLTRDGKNITKVFTSKDDDIKQGDTVRKAFILRADMADVQEVEFYYAKRPKFLFSDVSPKLFFDKFRITNIDLNEAFSFCGSQTLIEDQKNTRIPIREEDCRLA